MDAVDRELLESLVKGDPDAFRSVFDRIYVRLVQHAAFYVMDIDAAEDIAQDVMAGIWSDRHKLAGVVNFEGYVLRWVRNGCINHLTRSEVNNKYRQKQMVREAEEVETDPETYYKAIYELIGRMPGKRRQVFELSVFQSKTYAEIAGLTGISVNTVKEHIKAAYAYLRKQSAHIPYP